MASDVERLYSELHSVQIDNESHNTKLVRITLNVGKNDLHQKILQIKLNDENDPFCIYNAEINDEAYTVLKKKQGLLVDFATFPNEFISLLKKCRQRTQAEGRFFVIIKDDGSPTNDALGRHHIVFKLVETNCLRYLFCVMLTLAPVDISEVYKEMLMKLKRLKESVSLREHFYNQSIIKFKDTSDKLEQKNRELEKLKIQWNEAQKNWGKSLASQISDIRAEYNAKLLDQSKLQATNEAETHRHRVYLVKQLHEKSEMYWNENRKVNDLCQELMQANSVIKILQAENAFLKNEVEPLNKKCKLSSTDTDNLRVMPSCSTNDEAENEKDNTGLNHTTDTLYSTSVQGDKVTPNTSKDCKRDPNGIKKMLNIPQVKGSVKYRSKI